MVLYTIEDAVLNLPRNVKLHVTLKFVLVSRVSLRLIMRCLLLKDTIGITGVTAIQTIKQAERTAAVRALDGRVTENKVV